MPSQRTIKFRPSIVLFVGSCGEQIHGHFIGLCAGLDELLHAGVACIQVREDGKQAKRVPVTAHDTRFQDYQWNPLRVVFDEALEEDGVQGERAHDAIVGAGYDIENGNTQVIIAAHTGMRATATVQLATVAQQIRAFLVNEEVPTQIYYVLSDYRTYNQTTPIKDHIPPQWADNLYGGGNLPSVTFCFIYQKKGRTQQTFTSQRAVEYATAEAIFGLVATSVVAVPALAEALQTSPRVVDITERIGSLGTSLIRFPRAEASDYCSQRLAADLLEHWTLGLHRGITPANRKKQQDEAEKFEQRVRIWIGGKLWAFPGDQHWPHLKRLSPNGQELLQRYATSSAKLFEPLRTREVERTASARAGDDAWSEAVTISAGRTRDSFPGWQISARGAWAQAETEIVDAVTATVDKLWLDDEGSWEEANEYVGHLSERLVETKEQLIKWRKFHERRYRRELTRLLRMAPPARDDTSGSITGTEDTEITGLVRPDARGTPLGDDSLDGLPPPLPSQRGASPTSGVRSQPGPASGKRPEKDPLEDDLRRVRRGVERRIAYQRKLVPHVSTLVGAGLVADPPLSLLALDLLPDAWRTNLVLASAVFLGIGLLLALVSGLYRSWTLGRLDEAELALIACYENLYRYRCDRYEDNLRAELTMGLHWRVQDICDVLRDWPQLICDLRNEFKADAAATEVALFSGPSGAHDVLIGNGEWLRTSLSPVYDVMRREQVGNPAVGWHSTFEQINDHLRDSFRASSRSVIGGGKEAFKDSIVAFTRPIVEPYLGRSANIGAALSATQGANREDIWAAALRRSKPLYSGYGGGTEETIVCGRAAELRAVADLPRGRHNTVRTKDVERNREWMLVAQFIQGGARTNWPPRFTPSGPASGSPFTPGASSWDADDFSDDDDFSGASPKAPPPGDDDTPSGVDLVFQHESDAANLGLPLASEPEESDPLMPPGYGEDRSDSAMPPGPSAEQGAFEAPPGPGATGSGYFEAPPGIGRNPDEWYSPATDSAMPPAPGTYPSSVSFFRSDTPRSDTFPPGVGIPYDKEPTPDDDDDEDDDEMPPPQL
ncbi:MAG: hypothetical protein ACRDHP_15570 [Ktedonobacterales bacterium]